MRGNLAVDSSASRLFAAESEFTSCDLPVPHYHFQAKEVKWVAQSVLVARPAVLYIRDVPVAWLPNCSLSSWRTPACTRRAPKRAV